MFDGLVRLATTLGLLLGGREEASDCIIVVALRCEQPREQPRQKTCQIGKSQQQSSFCRACSVLVYPYVRHTFTCAADTRYSTSTWYARTHLRPHCSSSLSLTWYSRSLHGSHTYACSHHTVHKYKHISILICSSKGSCILGHSEITRVQSTRGYLVHSSNLYLDKAGKVLPVFILRVYSSIVYTPITESIRYCSIGGLNQLRVLGV